MEIAHRAEAHGMDVCWWGPREKPGERRPRAESLQDLAERSDVLFIALRATGEIAGIVDDEVLSALGPAGILVNVARGSLVDEDALREFLESGRLGGAALDVFASEPVPGAAWEGLGDKVLLTPHLAGFTQEAGRDMFGQLRENLRRHFAGEPLLTPNPGA
jgi:phosphoglycerate dehydrogenase-like enzyme